MMTIRDTLLYADFFKDRSDQHMHARIAAKTKPRKSSIYSNKVSKTNEYSCDIWINFFINE